MLRCNHVIQMDNGIRCVCEVPDTKVLQVQRSSEGGGRLRVVCIRMVSPVVGDVAIVLAEVLLQCDASTAVKRGQVVQ